MTGPGPGPGPGPGADRDSGNDGNDSFARGLQAAFRQTRLHSPQAVPGVQERLRGKLAAHGITLTEDILQALAYAIANDRGADA